MSTPKKFAIISASTDDQFDWLEGITRLHSFSLHKGCNITSAYNARPLTIAYNEILKEIRDDKLIDYAIFIHSDVVIEDLYFLDKIAKSEFDVIGVAGATAIDMRVTPLSWYNAAKDARDRRGLVNHQYHDGRQYMSLYSNGTPLSSKCLCIDGVCMVMNRKAIDSGLQFDERFAFDFYDMDLSLQAVIDYKLNVGVEPLYITHRSIGGGIMKDSYKVAEKAFREKWELRLKG